MSAEKVTLVTHSFFFFTLFDSVSSTSVSDRTPVDARTRAGGPHSLEPLVPGFSGPRESEPVRLLPKVGQGHLPAQGAWRLGGVITQTPQAQEGHTAPAERPRDRPRDSLQQPAVVR